MAFNRTITVGGKNYRQLVESRWDPEKKQSKIHVIKHLGRVIEEEGKEKLIPSQSNVATAHPTAAELRGMIVPSLCSSVFIQNPKASFGQNLLFLP